jgi:hypothetical protein
MDPLRYLKPDGLERAVVDAVIQKAQQLRLEELGKFAEAVGAQCAASVAKMMR